jgi:hypothetical protein
MSMEERRQEAKASDDLSGGSMGAGMSTRRLVVERGVFDLLAPPACTGPGDGKSPRAAAITFDNGYCLTTFGGIDSGGISGLPIRLLRGEFSERLAMTNDRLADRATGNRSALGLERSFLSRSAYLCVTRGMEQMKEDRKEREGKR